MPIPERVTPAREKCNAPIASKCGRPSFPAPSWPDRFPNDRAGQGCALFGGTRLNQSGTVIFPLWLLPQCALFASRWFYRGALEKCSCTTFHSFPCFAKTCVPRPRILRAFCLVLPGRPRPSCTLQENFATAVP